MKNEENVHGVTPEPVIHHSDGKHSRKASDKKNALAIPAAIIIAGLLIATSIVLTSNGGVKGFRNAANTAAITDENLKIREDDHVIGNKKADVLLFVWSDPECPFCKRYHETLQQVIKKYENRVAVVYRHFALDFHTYAKKEAESMECAQKVAGDEGFQKYVNKLFEITEGNNALKREDLTKIATQVNLDVKKFDACVDSGEMADRVQKDMDSGVEAGVMGTPFSIAVSTKTGRQSEINGALPLEMVSAKINQLLK